MSDAEAYLEPSQTSTVELSCENSELLKVIAIVAKKDSGGDV